MSRAQQLRVPVVVGRRHAAEVPIEGKVALRAGRDRTDYPESCTIIGASPSNEPVPTRLFPPEMKSTNRPQFRLVSLARTVGRRFQAAGSLFYPPYSVLSIRSDGAGWVLDEEARALMKIASSMGLNSGLNLALSSLARQCCHHMSQHILRQDRPFPRNQRVSINYFHGDPASSPEFAANYSGLKRHHPRLTRVRVSHSLMGQVALEAGIDPMKVRRIPIGVALDRFPMRTLSSRAAARRRLELPETAVVLGSFQKDGVGWDHGSEPKLIKGPDILLRTLAGIRASIPQLWILLTGPARGFVREGLVRAGIPFKHVAPAHHAEMAECYQALDAYLITSRDEGGPKGLLEAMATGVPVITTRVGQAIDLARSRENAWVVESEDVDGLVEGVLQMLGDSMLCQQVVARARGTAEANSNFAQRVAWADFFNGYVER